MLNINNSPGSDGYKLVSNFRGLPVGDLNNQAIEVAQAEAAQNSPAWQQAISEYNSTGKASDPAMQILLLAMNEYDTQGNWAPGKIGRAHV